eukprot:1318081-Rhodomonas_salina.1
MRSSAHVDTMDNSTSATGSDDTTPRTQTDWHEIESWLESHLSFEFLQHKLECFHKEPMERTFATFEMTWKESHPKKSAAINEMMSGLQCAIYVQQYVRGSLPSPKVVAQPPQQPNREWLQANETF